MNALEFRLRQLERRLAELEELKAATWVCIIAKIQAKLDMASKRAKKYRDKKRGEPAVMGRPRKFDNPTARQERNRQSAIRSYLKRKRNHATGPNFL